MAAINIVPLADAISHNRFSAEFFDPRYVFTPKETSTWLPIGRVLTKCEYGLSISMNTEAIGFPMFRMNEIDNCLAQRPAKYANISKSLFAAYHLNKRDVLFNRTNSFEFVGRTGVVADQTDCTFASYLIRLVPNQELVLPEYLTIFLNTQFGIGQIRRRAMRSINQANVSGSEVRKILIPIVSKQKQEEVAAFVNNAIAAIRKSEASYLQATMTLESELGLDKLKFNKPIGFSARFSELEKSYRSDAQHFQPRFTQLLTHLNKFSTKRIREIRCYNRRGLQPEYVKNGTINVVNSQHLSSKHIDYAGLEKTSPAEFALAPVSHIYRNDLLVYTTGAYIGRTNVYLSDELAMASNHVNILRMSDGIDAAYMSLIFQSVVGQFQTQKHARGSAQAELYPADIDKFVVPLLPFKKQEAIGNLLRESLVKQQESARLLVEAKARVDQLIEEAVKS